MLPRCMIFLLGAENVVNMVQVFSSFDLCLCIFSLAWFDVSSIVLDEEYK